MFTLEVVVGSFVTLLAVIGSRWVVVTIEAVIRLRWVALAIQAITRAR